MGVLVDRSITFKIFLALLPIALSAFAINALPAEASTSSLYVSGAHTGFTSGIAFDANGNLYGTSMQRIIKVPAAADGTADVSNISTLYDGSTTTGPCATLRVGAGPTKAGIHYSGGIAINPIDGSIFVSDADGSKIVRVTTLGVCSIYYDLSAVGNFTPRGLQFDNNGNLFVADQRGAVIKIAAGNSPSLAGPSTSILNSSTPIYDQQQTSVSTGPCENPFGLTINVSGDVFVGCLSNSYGDSIVRLKRNIDGTYTAKTWVQKSTYWWPYGLGTDSVGNIYVAWQNQQTLDRYAPGATEIDAPTESPVITGGFQPSAMATDLVGNIFGLIGSDVFKVADIAPPFPPTGISLSTSVGQIQVGWNNPGLSGIVTYSVYNAATNALLCQSTGNPPVNTCTVTGLADLTSYSIYVNATNGFGTSARSQIYSITTPVSTPAFTLSSTAETATAGSAIQGYSITSTGGLVGSYSISPTIANGLHFSTSTGLISGIPTIAATALFYTITGTNATGSVSATYSITVNAAPIVLTPTPVPDPIQRSKISRISPDSAYAKSSTPVVISGEFPERISNIAINNVCLPIGSWIQTPTSVSFTMPGRSVGTYQIQLYNGSAPVLNQLGFAFTQPAVDQVVPTPVPTQTPEPVVAPTPAPTSVTNIQPVASMKKLATFHFAVNCYKITTSMKSGLVTLASELMKLPNPVVLVYGNTDSQTGVDNGALSKKRSLAVEAFLRPLLHGKTIQIGWYAATKPVMRGNTEAAYAANRRVEIWMN